MGLRAQHGAGKQQARKKATTSAKLLSLSVVKQTQTEPAKQSEVVQVEQVQAIKRARI